jgi:hypothetical protein
MGILSRNQTRRTRVRAATRLTIVGLAPTHDVHCRPINIHFMLARILKCEKVRLGHFVPRRYHLTFSRHIAGRFGRSRLLIQSPGRVRARCGGCFADPNAEVGKVATTGAEDKYRDRDQVYHVKRLLCDYRETSSSFASTKATDFCSGSLCLSVGKMMFLRKVRLSRRITTLRVKEPIGKRLSGYHVRAVLHTSPKL